MKKIYLFNLYVLFFIGLSAQAPNSFNYQAVVRNSSGLPLATTGHQMWVYDNTASTSYHCGIYGEMANSAQSTYQTAIWGQIISTSGAGVAGVHNAGGFGVYAVAGKSGYGIYASAGTSGYAVYANIASSTEYAFYGIGKCAVTGTFSKASGTFKIDHPQDPNNKFLYYSFVESLDMMNIYNGNISTDAERIAIVTMPTYFEALNMDFRYQLTVMGTFAQAIVFEKMSNNQFKIKTDKPNIEVSWQVTGVRHDNWANANRVVPEVAKTETETGTYQNPEVFGQPESKRWKPKMQEMPVAPVKPAPTAQPIPSNVPSSINSGSTK